MSQCILFKTEDGTLAYAVPTEEALERYTIQEIAEKDIPQGTPYKIANISDLPEDMTFRDAWEIADEELTDGVGGEFDMFADDPQHPNNQEVVV